MRRGEAGITLIELLLAVSLFAAISVSMAMVLNVSFTSMNKIEDKVDFNRRVVASQRALDQILQGLIPVLAPCGGKPVGFSGMPQGVRFVSSYSLTEGNRGRPQIVELFVGPSPNGGVRLLLNEQPYLGKPSFVLRCGLPFVAQANTFILADRLKECSFGYRRIDPANGMEGWFSGWAYPDWPSAIRIAMSPLEIKANQVPPATIYAPLLVKNRSFDDVVY